MEKNLVSALCDGRYNGKPILVIGGGPSVARDIRHIPLDYPACVISANEHGFKQDRFKVDFIVGVDYYYGGSQQRMQDYVKQFNTPTINWWSWADYRLPEWHFSGDSGMTAIVVAAILGGHPVVPLGMDRYVGDRRYFWQTEAEAGWTRRRNPNVDAIRENTRRCVQYCQDTQVRMFDGPLRAYFPEWNYPVEEMPAWTPCDASQRTSTGKLYSLRRQIFLHPSDPVGSGPVLLTDGEATGLLRLQSIEPYNAHTPVTLAPDNPSEILRRGKA